MSRMKWDQIGERLFETGLDHGVLFPMGNNGKYAKGVPWNGLSAVNETPSGGEPNAVWADNIKYLNLMSAEDFGATVEAYTYPPEFEECDGSAEVAPGVTIGQQNRKMFGLSYRTLIGNDVVGQNYGYKLHLVYGAQASPSEKNRQTVNDSPEATAMSWSMTTTPVNVPGYKATAHMLNEFVEKVVVHERVSVGRYKRKQRVDVYFNFIGLVELPTEPEDEPPAAVEPPQERYVAVNTSFAPLGEYLSQQTEDSVTLSFADVERVIGKPLCKSAFKFYSYWYPGSNRPISNVIYNAGFDVDRVDLKNQLLYLIRAI